MLVLHVKDEIAIILRPSLNCKRPIIKTDMRRMNKNDRTSKTESKSQKASYLHASAGLDIQHYRCRDVPCQRMTIEVVPRMRQATLEA